MAVDLRVVGGFLAHLIGLFPPPIITVHLAYTFEWSGCKTSISLTHSERGGERRRGRKRDVSQARVSRKARGK